MGRFISKDSVEGNITNPLSLNLYVYCNSNPVNRIDPSGHDSYVFYDPGDNGFTQQAKTQKKLLEEYYDTEAHLIPITTEDEFKEAWNNMGNNCDIEYVALLLHGNPHSINIEYKEKEYLTTLSTGKTKKGVSALYIGDLNSKKINILAILSCNAGHLNHLDDNVAVTFLKNNNIDKVVAWDGSLSYTKIWGDYIPRLAVNQEAFRYWAPDKTLFGFEFDRMPVGPITYTKGKEGNINYRTGNF